jgi:hypothetical protein
MKSRKESSIGKKMAGIITYLSILTTSLPIKRHRMLSWVKQQDSAIC